MTEDQKALLAAIEDAPDEWTGKLVYADWLDEHGFPEDAAWVRSFDPSFPQVPLTRDEFNTAIVAQDDDNNYEESGWVAVVLERSGVQIAALVHYSHCSCYGTWTSLADSYDTWLPKWAWVGSVPALVGMAERGADPVLPDRTVAPDDYDADHLLAVYVQVLKWNRTRVVEGPTCGSPRNHENRSCKCCVVPGIGS